jgi:hypothetical protein
VGKPIPSFFFLGDIMEICTFDFEVASDGTYESEAILYSFGPFCLHAITIHNDNELGNSYKIEVGYKTAYPAPNDEHIVYTISGATGFDVIYPRSETVDASGPLSDYVAPLIAGRIFIRVSDATAGGEASVSLFLGGA